MADRSTIVIRVRETTKGASGFLTALWALCIAVCLFGMRAFTHHLAYDMLGLIATVAFAAYLGWRRRMGLVFVAPIVSWLFAWPFLWVGEIVRDGFTGIFWGFLWITFGFVAIAAAEFVALMVLALPFRLISGTLHHDRSVIIENPFRG
jgi:hypothetical protein